MTTRRVRSAHSATGRYRRDEAAADRVRLFGPDAADGDGVRHPAQPRGLEAERALRRVNISRSAGSSVIARIAATTMHSVLV